MEYVSGEILTPNGFEKGYLGFEGKTIIETGKNSPPKKSIFKGYIIPTFVNTHTHIGDSFIRKKDIKLPKDVEKLVGAPHGLKHKLLKEVSNNEIIDGMRESIKNMINSGVSCFCDFRENGIDGVNLLKKSLNDFNIQSLILSRPKKIEYKKDEVDLLLKNSDGIGISSILDWDYSELKKLALHTKRNSKIFAIHASERIREDIDLVLDLKPDFVVHMTCATEDDIIRVKESDIPIVVCPRSNNFFGLKPKLELFKKHDVSVLIGTDNCMLNSPNILDEIHFIKNNYNVYSFEELLFMTTYNPSKALNLEYNILGQNSPARFVVLDKHFKSLYISNRINLEG